jgi:hypothetical protein
MNVFYGANSLSVIDTKGELIRPSENNRFQVSCSLQGNASHCNDLLHTI